jgi:hypothetical protein
MGSDIIVWLTVGGGQRRLPGAKKLRKVLTGFRGWVKNLLAAEGREEVGDRESP